MTESFPRLQARTQRFTLGTPRSFQVSPDGSRVLFLRSASGTDRVHRLYSVDVATGAETCLLDPATVGAEAEERLPAEERARRERSRNQGAGVQGYACDTACTVAAVALSGQLYAVDLGSGAATALPAAGAVVDPRPSPDGAHIAYVCDGALRVIGTDGAQDREAAGPMPGEHDVTWGLAEFIAAEEMSRHRGFWWSPDGRWLLAERADSSALPTWTIADPANPEQPARTVRYPAAGAVNADVGLALVSLDGQRVPVHWDVEAYEYLAAVHWSEHGPPLLSVLSGDQRSLAVLAVDTTTGATTALQERTDPVWIDLVPGTPAWTSGGSLVTVGEHEGSHRLFLDGEPVTGPGLQVRSVLDVAGDVLVSASEPDPTQIHVYRSSAGGTTRLSTVDGVHGAARGGGTTVLTSLRLDEPGARVLARHAGGDTELATLAESPPMPVRPRMLELGERGLRGALLLPNDHLPGTKLPVLLDPYGGPHAQRVLAAHGAYVTPQWLADQGFAVLVVDGRGSPGRGPAWEKAIAHELAEVTLADQVDALHAAAERFDELDTSRVAIRGWSYGGYLAALAVLRRPDVFHAAIAGAPVTDWALYDTHYSERYLGMPQDNPEVYKRNSLIGDADRLRGELLIIHGLADDNVFAAHGLRLSAELLRAGRAHSMIPMPGVTHMSPADERSAENFLLFQVNWLRRALGIED